MISQTMRILLQLNRYCCVNINLLQISTMSDIQQLVDLISNILQPNSKQLRDQAEGILVGLRVQKPNELMLAFVNILQSQAKLEHRNFSATQLRLCLSQFSPSTYTNVWPTLSEQVQKTIKTKLFQIIYKEEDHSMKRHIADTLGQVAGSLLSKDDKQWPEFKINVWTLFQDQNINSNLAAFAILETFFTCAPAHFKNDSDSLYVLFKAALSHQNNKLKQAALKCFASYLEVLQTKKHTSFQQLVIPIFQAVYSMMVGESNEQGLQILSQMIEIQPKFFKKKFKELNQLLQKIFGMPKIQSSIKRMVTEILVDYAEKYPALFRKSKQILARLIEMIFIHMVEIENEITDEWKSPPEGYNDEMENDDDFQTTRFGMGAVDRIIFTVGEQQLLPILSETIQKLILQPDWRYKYTAIMALSQIGEYIDEVQKISSIMQMIVIFLNDSNPMLRYSACHAIGQISDDMQPKFQQKYGDIIFPLIMQLLKDPIPRIVSHSAAALTNFLEGMKFSQIQSKADQLMELLLFHCSNGISLVKQSCLSTISSVAEIALHQFNKYFDKTAQILFAIFTKHTTKQYKQLKGQTIQTLTIIASSIGGQAFKPAATQLIQLMIEIQSSPFQQVDPQKTYILSGWQRLCLLYGKKLSDYLDKILPSLFVLVENVINNQLKVVNNFSEKQEKPKSDLHNQDHASNTFQTEEAEIAISMLNVFIEQLKELYGPYVQKTVHLLCKIISDHPNDDVKHQACKCLPNLISGIKITNQGTAIQMAKYFMGILVSTIQKQFDTEIMIIQLETLKNVIDTLGLSFLTETQLSVFSQKILNLLKSSDEKKFHSNNYINEEDVDDQEKEMIGQEIKQEEQVQVAISQLIGVLFKTHKSLTVNFAAYLIDTVLPETFKPKQSENMLKFGIFLIDDMVQFLGFQIIQKHWWNFAQILQKFTSEKNCVIRQAACYGLGVLATETPPNQANPMVIQSWLHSLFESAKINKGTQKEKVYGHCRDNIIAAMGKIIKQHLNTFNSRPYLLSWLSMLPLRFDKPQAIQQHQFLSELMINNCNFVLGSDPLQKNSILIRILNIFADIVINPKIQNDKIKGNICGYLQILQKDQYFIANSQSIWSNLSQKQRKQLGGLCNMTKQ